MKTKGLHIFIGVVIVGLTFGHAALQAEPTSDPRLTDGDDKPWNQGVSTEDRQAARELFLEGNRRFRIPLFAKAAEKYMAALERWKHPAIYFNLALAQLNIGQEVAARDNLEHALQYGEEPLGVEQFQEAQKQFQEAERQLGWIRVVCPTEGAEVILDGVTLFTGPGSYQGRITAKAHQLAAKRVGYLAVARRVMITSGQLQNIDLKLLTLTEAEDAGRRWAVWKPWSVVATGAAVAAAGGVLHAVSSRNFYAYDAKFVELNCAQAAGCKEADIGPTLNSQLRLARQEQKVAVGGYIAGGSLIAAGVVLMYLNRPRLMEQGASSSPARSVEVVPAVSGDMIGILVFVNH